MAVSDGDHGVKVAWLAVNQQVRVRFPGGHPKHHDDSEATLNK